MINDLPDLWGDEIFKEVSEAIDLGSDGLIKVREKF